MKSDSRNSKPNAPVTDRGQAFTLEGVIGSLVVLIGVLIALQSTVITPTTGGTVDDETRQQLQQQANDILVVVAENETRDLSWYIRYWNPNTRTFYDAKQPDIGYGDKGPPGDLGVMLNQTFSQNGRQYNLVLRFRGSKSPNSSGTQRMVYQGPPAEHAVIATYTITLFDSQALSGPKATDRELHEYDTNASDNDDSFYPIPDVAEGPVYNVVEVRLTVW